MTATHLHLILKIILANLRRKPTPFKFRWEDFGYFLKRFISRRQDELELDNIYLILSFKRGGSILAQSFVCMLQDTSGYYDDLPCIRDIPSGILCKEKIPTFLNRMVANQTELSDIPRIKEEIITKIKKRMKETNKERISIFLVDDNITTGKRLMFFKSLITKWMKDLSSGIAVKSLIFCSISPKLAKEKFDYVIFEDSRFRPSFIQMPWHHERIPDAKIMENETLPLQIIFRHNKPMDFNALLRKFKDYERAIYNNVGLEIKKDSHKSIFEVEEHENLLKIFSGSIAYHIQILGSNLRVAMTGDFCSISQCHEDNFIIEEPEYRLCGSTAKRTHLCYQCLHWYYSRDVLFLVIEFLKEEGMTASQLKEITLKYHPKTDERLEKEQVISYMHSLYHEKKESVQIFGGSQ